MKVLVTGASGFVGRAAVARLAADRHDVVAAARGPLNNLPSGVQQARLNALGGDCNPLINSSAVDVVVHAAGRAHVMQETTRDPLAAFREVNVNGSLAIARQTRDAGARRFVFLSSIKVLGERSQLGRPFNAESLPAPVDAYGRSKLEAEQALAEFCDSSDMELVVIRPPLVYGPGVKANFERLLQAVSQRRPLPFGRLDANRRSLVSLDNLVDLISSCVGHVAAPRQTLLVSDDEDLSTVELVRRLARSLGVAPRLVPVPVWALLLAGTTIGRRDAVRRLCESLQVDIGGTRRRLGWVPPVTVEDALARMADHFLRGATK